MHRHITPVAVAIASVALMGACSASAHVSIGKNEVSKSDVEAGVAKTLADQVHQPEPKVTCPSGLEAKVGATLDCQLVAQGDTTAYPVHVTVDRLDGSTAHYSAEVGKAPISTTTSGG